MGTEVGRESAIGHPLDHSGSAAFYNAKLLLKLALRELPIPRATPEQQAPIVALVEQVLAAKAADPAADTAALEGEIDARVAELYGLTVGEVGQL